MLFGLSQKRAVSKPIFIVGSGRSGTTLLYRILSGHPDLAWISVLTNRFPRLPQLLLLNRLSVLQSHRFVRPSLEAINAYNYCGVTNDLLKEKSASLIESDVSRFSMARLRKLVAAHTRWMGRPRFINKNTGNTMRIRYLRRIFPDALFVHIIRNGYAVANSLYNVDWWPDLELWWLKRTPKQWEEEGKDPYELCALHWKRQLREILGNKNQIPLGQYLECRYKDMLTCTHDLLQDILRFCQLEWNKEFTEHLNRIPIILNTKDKWRGALDASAKRAITRAAGDLLQELGYDTDE